MVYKKISYLKYKQKDINWNQRRMLKKYLDVLKELELASLKLDAVSMHNFQKEHLLTSRIAMEIHNQFCDGINNKNKSNLKKSMKIMQEETKRLSSVYKKVSSKKFDLTFTKDSAKSLLLKYISEKDISNELLNCFDENISKKSSANKESSVLRFKSKAQKADVLPRSEIQDQINQYKRLKAMALVSGLLVLYNISPGINYSLIKHNIIPKNQITMELDEGLDKTENVKLLFAESINKNHHLKEEAKEKFIDAFNKYFLNDHAYHLDEKTIINMCIVAQTQDVKKINVLFEDISPYSGKYNPLSNRISYVSGASDKTKAHEQLHAILRYGPLSTGLSDNSSLLGDAINEGMTENFVNDNFFVGCAYYNERILASSIGLIIGNDKLSQYTLNYDPDSLITELCKYSTKKEVIELLRLSDYEIKRKLFLSSAISIITEAENIGLFSTSQKERLYSMAKEKYYDEDYYDRQAKIKGILTNMYEAKIGKKMEEDPLGTILKYSENFKDSKEPNPQQLNYALVFVDPDHTKIAVRKKETDDFSSLVFENEKLQNLDFDTFTEIAMDKINLGPNSMKNGTNSNK